MSRLTEYHCGVAVIKNKELLKEAMEKLARYEDLEDIKKEQEKESFLKIMLNANGEAEFYDDTWDITIHCTSQEEHKKCVELLNLAGKYKSLAEQGRLLELPCGAGDTVYEVINNTDACRNCDYFSYGRYGSVDMCEKTVDYTFYPQYAKKPVCKKHFMEVQSRKIHLEQIVSDREKFGKTVFLTKEEAEKTLEEMRKKV